MHARKGLDGRFATYILCRNQGLHDKELIDIVKLFYDVDSECLMQVNEIGEIPLFMPF